MERIIPSYSGPAIRIQRLSDNAQTDIYFLSSGAVDTGAIQSFTGSASTTAYVVELYDQSGNGNNVTQTTVSNAPSITVSAPTSTSINGVAFTSARSVINSTSTENAADGPGYWNLPSSLSVNMQGTSVVLAYTPDFSGGEGFEEFNIGNSTSTTLDLLRHYGGYYGVVAGGNAWFPFNSGVYARQQPTVLALTTSSSAAPVLYIDGVAHQGSYNVSNATLVGGTLMGGPHSFNTTFANFMAFAIYSSTLSSSQVSSISSTLLPRSVPSVNIVGDGDSITEGHCATYGRNALNYAGSNLSKPADITNIALGGTTTSNPINNSSSPSVSGSHIGTLYRSGATNIYYLAIGTNDIHVAGSTGAATWANVQTILGNAKALGYKTAVATIMHEAYETSAQGNEVNSFNSSLRAAAGGGLVDAIVDYAANSDLSAPNFAASYACDGTHPNDAGYAVMGGIAANTFNSLLGSSNTPSTYTLSVSNGSGSGSYASGTSVTVTANAPASGYTFSGWSGSTSVLANASAQSTTLTMPSSAVNISANYTALPPTTYALSVSNGSGSGSYTAGTSVTVTANAPSSGYTFSGWSGSTSSLANASSQSTTLTMPSSAVSISANYTALPPTTYALAVNGGTGTGTYAAGTQVTISANAAGTGFQFSGWSGSTAALTNSTAATTTLTMPAGAAAVTANYTPSATATVSPGPPGSKIITSVQFPQYYSHGIVEPMNANNYTGGVLPVQNWNMANTDTGTAPYTSSSTLVTSTGASTPYTFTYSGYTLNDGSNNFSFPAAVWYQSGGQADGYIAAGSSFNMTGAPITLTVNNLLPTHSYNLVAYITAPWWANNGSEPASVAVGSTTYYIRTSNSLGSWTEASSISSSAPTTGNYAEFNNLTGATSQTLTLTGIYVGLGGFQLVDTGVASGSSSAPATYGLTVNSGTGTGTYAPGTVVNVTANAPATGYTFSGWTGATSSLASTSSATTTFTMPSAAAAISATYTAIPSVPVVISGTPTGTTVSVQFPQYYAHGLVGPMNANNYVAGVVQVQNWNVEDTDTGKNPASNTAPLVTSTGASTPYGFTYSGYSINDGTNNDSFPAPVWYQSGGLADMFLAAGSSFNTNGAPENLLLTGLNPTHTYALIAYVTSPWWAHNGSETASVTAGGTTFYITTSNTLSAWTISTSTSASTATTGNYVQFSALSGSATQTVTVTGAYVGLAGFQLIDTTH